MSNPNSQEGKGGGSQDEKPIFAKYGKKHLVKCLVGTNNCFGCGKSDHMVRSGPIHKTQVREGNQAQASCFNSDSPKKNHFYALYCTGDQEDSPDVVTGMLQVFSVNVYALIHPSATFCFVNPLVSMEFEVLPVS